jgi:hypothetical protein
MTDVRHRIVEPNGIRMPSRRQSAEFRSRASEQTAEVNPAMIDFLQNV